MMHDDELRARFAELRSTRERETTRYDDVRDTVMQHATAARVRRRRRMHLALATIPVLAAFAAWAVPEARARRQLEQVEAVNALVYWRSPTSALLYDTYSDWMRTTPAVRASTIVPPVDGGSQ
jgi:hypothetical protein